MPYLEDYLDDEFRKSLKDCPAGQLENDLKLKRWLPTVKQRVEQLQKQAAMAMKDPETEFPYAAAAEIMLLGRPRASSAAARA